MADNFLITTGTGPNVIRAIEVSSGLYIPVNVDAPFVREASSVGLTTAEYTANKVVGGVFSFTNIGLSTGRGLVIESARLIQTTLATAGTPSFSLILFNRALTTTTIANNAALSVTAADIVNIEGVISFSTKKDVGGGSIYQTNPALRVTPNSKDLFGVLIADSTFTLGTISSTGIKISLQGKQ